LTRALAPLGCLLLSACGGSVLPIGGTGSDGGPPAPGDLATLGGASVTLSMDPFTVGAGEEVYKYQDFANPFGGADADVVAWESHMSHGSHHLLVFYEDITKDGPLTVGNGLMFGPTPFGAQQPDLLVSYPPGVAARVPGAKGLRLQAHYLNASPSAIQAVVTVTLHEAMPGTITQQAGVFFMINPLIFIQPMSTQTVTQSCAIPYAANLIYATGHMHQHGTNFTASTAGKTFYQTSDWSQAPTEALAPPIAVTAGQQLTWSCTFVNSSPTQTLTFGESARTNEMCIVSGQYYPVPAGMSPLVGCM
jgi:hypothetical protein